MVDDLVLQSFKAIGFYIALIVMMRLTGKRMAGQTTAFDLLVLITLAVVIQRALLQDGATNAAVFVLTVFAAHRVLAALCTRWTWIRYLLWYAVSQASYARA